MLPALFAGKNLKRENTRLAGGRGFFVRGLAVAVFSGLPGFVAYRKHTNTGRSYQNLNLESWRTTGRAGEKKKALLSGRDLSIDSGASWFLALMITPVRGAEPGAGGYTLITSSLSQKARSSGLTPTMGLLFVKTAIILSIPVSSCLAPKTMLWVVRFAANTP